MTYFHLTRERTREHEPEYATLHTRPLARHQSKISRHIVLSDDGDDGADDYPYSAAHRPSRALTLRNQPSEIERYNIWSDRYKDETDDFTRRSLERIRTYKYSSPVHHHHYSLSDNDDDEEREFRLKIKASIGRPKSSQHHSHCDSDTRILSTDLFRRKDKWVDEEWETRERSTSRERHKRDSIWAGKDSKDEEKEKESRYRRVERTRTEDVYRPLSGWRRSRIVFES